MDINQVLTLGGAAFLTSIISSVAGFGGGLLIIVVMGLFFEVKEAIALSGLYFMFNNTNKAIIYRKTVDWEYLKYLFMGAIPAVFVGLYFFVIIPEAFIKMILGFLGFYLIFEHFFHFIPRLKNFAPPRVVLMGACWGFLTGAVNGMPLKVMLLKWRGLTKHTFIGTSAFQSFGVDSIKLVGYFFMGLLVWEEVVLLAPLFLIVSLVGTYIGKKILDRISTTAFEWIMLTLIFVGSVKLMMG